MRKTTLPFDKVPYLSNRDKAYISEHESLTPFYKYSVSFKAFEQIIKDKQGEQIDRETLYSVLSEQYAKEETSHLVKTNISLLKQPNTFTIVTGHQPVLATGPLYFIYKIVSTIKLAAQLNELYPSYRFVPVYWMGAEDHDFEEINHFRIFGKQLVWENDENGAVGEMSTERIGAVVDELKTILGNTKPAQSTLKLVKQAYLKKPTLAEATFNIVNQLFKQWGLIVLNPSHKDLKQLFSRIMIREIKEQPSQKLITNTLEKLEVAGYKAQANPREINLFYARKGLRERIVKEDMLYKVLNTDLQFTERELIAEVEEHPDRFSPNVALRPLYQELILPNLAYIGGGGEIAYWLERKSQFEYFGINFPMLVRRSSVLWIDSGTYQKMLQLGLDELSIFDAFDQLAKAFVTLNASASLNLDSEKAELESLFEVIAQKVKAIEPTLEPSVLAEKTKAAKGISNLENRIIKAEKRKHDQTINQIKKLKEKLFPGGGLQERKDNFLEYHYRYGDHFIETLVKTLNPLEKAFIVLIEETIG
ncbi:MAG: bacillithiol biosynthesis cysteine-adding enzyme BshC [Bacteroidota bacterium]